MLDGEAVEKIRGMLYGHGYREVFKPIVEERIKTLRGLALMLPIERPEPYKSLDDSGATSILKGEVRALEWVVNAFENEVKIADFNRKQEEAQINGANPAATMPLTTA